MNTGTGRYPATGSTVGALLLRSLVAAGLAVDAVIHLRLAGGYQLAAPGGIGEGTLFRIQAGLAIMVAVAILARPVWFPEKTLSAVAEAIAAVGGLILIVAKTRGRRRRDQLVTPVGALPPTATHTR